jgi:hypothetical protein
MGRDLTPGQRDAIEAVCTSGRGVELLVGIAGSGKTTALAAARDAFEAEGYEVIGTSTSGQAARTLSREAGIDSRTLASLNWRIAHGSLRLSPKHVAVLDEAAMTDDAALVAFLEAASVAGAKVVAVGDPRQLGSVGPGGGFEAIVRRFGGGVHVLTENVRQIDAGERAALAELRSGKVGGRVLVRRRRPHRRVPGPGHGHRRHRGRLGRRGHNRNAGDVRVAAGQCGRAEPSGPRGMGEARPAVGQGADGGRGGLPRR